MEPIAVAPVVVTLEKFWRDQFVDGQPTIALRTLEDMASSGRLPGAFRAEGSRIWFLSLTILAMQPSVMEGLQSGDAHGQAQTPPTPDPSARQRRRAKGRAGSVASKETEDWLPPASWKSA